MDDIQTMKIKAAFDGAQYDSGSWSVTIGGQRRRLTVELEPGYSHDDHLFDLTLAAIHDRITQKSAWSSLHALKDGIWRATLRCGCYSKYTVTLD